VKLKNDNIKKDNRIGFEADCSHKLIKHEEVNRFSMEYESVMGCGNIYMCESTTEKLHGLTAPMRHYAPDEKFTIPRSALAGVCVLRLDVLQITGKRNMC